ncbi:MAG TPA: isoprenylcysteine carboxylmethyltransferase family protein [Leptolinea sp.]
MSINQPIDPMLLKKVLIRFGLSLVFLMAVFFIPAGTFSYWYAWLYIAVLYIPLCFVLVYLLKNEPDLLERRMHTREPEKEQRLIIKLSNISFLIAYILPGLDFRFSWSTVPIWLVVFSAALVLIGYLFVVNVFRENQYASRVVEVEKEQQVISSGPYALVRHPMYFGVTVMYLFSPLALGSYWALIPALFTIPVLVFRLLNEEKVLERDLKGYMDYEKKSEISSLSRYLVNLSIRKEPHENIDFHYWESKRWIGSGVTYYYPHKTKGLVVASARLAGSIIANFFE